MLLVQQTTNEYYELLKVFIRFKANNLARETFKALADSNFIFDSRILNFTLAVIYLFFYFIIILSFKGTESRVFMVFG